MTDERTVTKGRAYRKPFSAVAGHMARNGLLLRSDVHKLFDAGYVTVTPEWMRYADLQRELR